jgi:tRNA nucleotidyltransferase (CCA-adding enzyme)
MDQKINQVINQALDMVKPTNGVQKIKQEILKIAEETVESKVRCLLVGSVARGTWLRGKYDVDLFMAFPEDVPLTELEEVGLELAKKIGEKLAKRWGGKVVERYADHPYIKVLFNEFEVDIVPCYDVKDPSNIRSPVDRTPHHNEYVMRYIKGKEDEVRLLKQFLIGAGLYGSELKRMGYSGYLCELLIIYYGSFIECIKAMAKWRRGIVIDIEKHGTKKHRDPLVVVDPVDPKRNVASALSLDNFAKSIHHARQFLKNPSIKFFIEKDEMPELDFSRGTQYIEIEFAKPDISDDILYPQIYKAMDSFERLLTSEGFRTYSKKVCEKDGFVGILFELEVFELPKVRKHIGPPVDERAHAERFYEKYSHNAHTLSDVYIEKGRYCIDLRRKYTKAHKLLIERMRECSLGKHLKEYLPENAKVLVGKDIIEKGKVFRQVNP